MGLDWHDLDDLVDAMGYARGWFLVFLLVVVVIVIAMIATAESDCSEQACKHGTPSYVEGECLCVIRGGRR